MPRQRKHPGDSPKRMTRSTKLRKYASVYKSYMRKSEQSKISKSPPKPIRKHVKEQEVVEKKKETPVLKKKTLNAYQKFVQAESKKDKYKELPGKQRLSAIAAEWKKINK